MKKTLLGFVIIFVGFAPMAASADMGMAAFQEHLNTLNRIKPLQSPKFEKSGDILKGNVIDRQNRAIGQVDDVLILSSGGAVSSVQVTFDRLRLDQSVYLNFDEMKMKTASNGYQLDMKGEDVTALYPELLANIQTAAGDSTEILSLKNVIGKPVVTPEGRTIGAIQDVLFGNKGAQVQAIYVGIDSGTTRNVGVAIPMDALSFEEHHGRMKAILPRDQAEFLVEYAKKSK